MTVKDLAREKGFAIVGKLTRRPEWETATIDYDHNGKPIKARVAHRAYIDEANNEYYISKSGGCIIAYDGGVL